jgi:peptidoglycan/LPS O-acetylase OafA/YrhL
LCLPIFTFFIAVCAFIFPNFPYAYAFIPTISGISFYWLCMLFIGIEKRSGFYPNRFIGKILDFLSECGQNSYEMYLTHSFVCWYGMKALSDFLSHMHIAYNDLLLYCILLIPSIIAVYFLGKLSTAFLRRR